MSKTFDVEAMLNKLINEPESDIPEEVEIIKYFNEEEEFDQIDYILFIHFFIRFTPIELVNASIIDSLTVEHFIEIERTNAYCFFESFMEIKQSEMVSNLFIEFLKLQDDISEDIKSIQSIMLLIECEEETATDLIDYFWSHFNVEIDDEYCKIILLIIFDLLRKMQCIQLDLSDIMNTAIECEMNDEIELRQFIISKISIMDESSVVYAYEFVKGELDELKDIAEYTELITNWVSQWNSNDAFFAQLFRDVISEWENSVVVKEFAELILAMLSSLEHNDDIWNECYEEISYFFTNETISSSIFQRFIKIIQETSDKIKDNFRSNESLLEKASEFNDTLINTFFNK